MRAGSIGRGIAVLCIAVAGAAWADADTASVTLHDFAARSASDYFLNADGVGSGQLLLAANGDLYGVRMQGGSGKSGTFFRLTSAGAFSVLREFAASGTTVPQYPRALIQDAAGDIYIGLNYSGRGIGLLKYAPGSGTFTELPPAAYATQGFSATTLTSMADGSNDGYVYVTAAGSTTTVNTSGAVIKIAKSNGAQTALKHFTDGADGVTPGGLTRAGDGNFYGFTKDGGGALVSGSREAVGTLFRISPTGTFATVNLFLKSELATKGNGMFSLALGSDGHLYGQTQLGGTSSADGGSGGGVLFRFTTAGQYTAIRERNRLGDYSAISHLNGVGQPFAATGGYLYGSKDYSIYRLSTAGVHDVLHVFTGAANSVDGHYVDHLLVTAGGVVYAMTARGGANDNGTIIRFDPSDGAALSLTADPTSVPDGGRTTLNWSSTGGASCTGIGGPPYTAAAETSWHNSTRAATGCTQSTITNQAYPAALEVTYALRCPTATGFVTASRPVQMTASTGTTSGPACPGSGGGDPPPAGAVALSDGVGRAIAGAGGSSQSFYIDVPAGAQSLTITIAGGSGDADLYVRKGSPATDTQYDCNSTSGSNNEECAFTAPGADRYHVLVYGYATFSGATLLADYVAGSGGGGGGGDGGGEGGGGGGGALPWPSLAMLLLLGFARRRVGRA